jgi:hypothetical protein
MARGTPGPTKLLDEVVDPVVGTAPRRSGMTYDWGFRAYAPLVTYCSTQDWGRTG